jgi:predicted AlkP superfamily pyrophosphatase or phosphodiesterase
MLSARAFAAVLFLCATAIPAQPQKDRTVVVISIDGLPAYAFDDPRLPAPTLRRLAREGAIAKGMRPVNPTVTWPNHTSMVTGVPPAVHGVLFNGMLVRQGVTVPPRIEPWRDKAEMVRVPTVYDLAYRAGLTTAQVDWVAIQNPGTITWEFAERPRTEGRIEQEMIAAGLLTADEVAQFAQANIVWRDRIWTAAALHIIARHKPNLLLFHVLDLDSVHHRYGPRSPASNVAIAYADDRVREIIEALRVAGLADRATVLVVSDHGFKSVRRNIQPNVILRGQGLTSADVSIISEGGTAMVYITNPAHRERLLPRVKEIFRAAEGVDRILDSSDFTAFGLPLPQDYDQMADLVLAAKNGYAFGSSEKGAAYTDVAEGGAHGYLSTDPEIQAIFIAWGLGIRPGVKLDVVENVDVAPTIAALLGLEMKNVRGKELSAALQ